MRVLCIGNPFYYPDNFAIKLIPLLQAKGFEVIEGGLGGLSLLPYFEEEEVPLIVDHGVGFADHFCTKEEVLQQVERYEHATAFYYLLATLEREVTLYLSNRLWREEELAEDVERIVRYAAKLRRTGQ